MSEKIPYEQVMGRMRLDIDYIAEGAYQKGLSRGYKDGYEAGQHEATTLEYQQGLDDAWECAKKIFGYEIDGGLPVDELRNAFGWESGPFCTADILRTNTASEAITKLKAYGEQPKPDKIVVGDEVKYRTDDCGVVTGIYGNYAYVLWRDGSASNYAADELIKTGRHFNFLASLLNAMKEGAE